MSMPGAILFAIYLLRLIQSYAAIGIRGGKVAASVADEKHTMPGLQQLQQLPGFRVRIRLPPASTTLFAGGPMINAKQFAKVIGLFV
jgi:hypothetical protein